jgi:uncharacterized repeat protein (TIGR01451 family)
MSSRRGETKETTVGVFQRPSLVVGALLAVLGTVLIFVPGLAAAIPGNDYVVLAVGGIALLAAVDLIYRRRRADPEAAETGDPEVALPLPVPGTSLQRDLDRIDGLRQAPLRTRKRVRNRLHEAAVAVVRRRERVSQATAEQLVATGQWTDDPYARLFVGDPDLVPRLSRRENVRARASLRSRFGFEARRTAEAVLELADSDPDPDDGGAEETLTPGPATDDRTRPFDRETGRWTGVGALALLSGAVGVVVEQPGVLLLSVVGVTYAAFAFRARPVRPDLAFERRLSVRDGDDTTDGDDTAGGGADDPSDDGAGSEDGSPSVTASPGDVVEVTLTVENAGEETVSDCRIVDGVPPGLTVVEGSPRLGTALRPGKTATLTYAVEAARGDHEFGPTQVLVRDASGANERDSEVETPGRITCFPELDDAGTVPLYGAATRYTGRVSTETGGDGLEFYATREYRPGDPPNRVDWNRHARTRELATLLFREERAATVVLLVDTRTTAFQAPGPGEPHAVARSVEAAGRVFESLLAGGDRVGLASFGPRSCWVAPGAGNTHREQVRRALATSPAFAYEVPDEQFLPSARLADIRRRAPVDAQFVLFTPLTDDYVETVARRLQAHGYPVTVVSPDVTTGGSLARRLVQVERQTRLNALREADIRVVDWDPGEELAVALQRASVGWSG